ncbi:MAG: hypothetical protein HY053_06520 [Proteobacteria bacterium]|nr:hypothetical protein [Pseudomonadota bacterium]
MQKTSTNAALAGAQENISVPEAGQERSGFGSSNFLFVSAALLGVRAWRTALKVFDLAVDYALPLILRGLSVGVLLLPRIVFSAGFNAAKVVAFARHFKNKEKRSESIQKISERWKRMRDSVFSWKWYEHKIHDGVAWAIPRVYNGMKKRGPYASLAIVSLATVFGVPLCIAGWGLSHAFGFWLMFQGTGIWRGQIPGGAHRVCGPAPAEENDFWKDFSSHLSRFQPAQLLERSHPAIQSGGCRPDAKGTSACQKITNHSPPPFWQKMVLSQPACTGLGRGRCFYRIAGRYAGRCRFCGADSHSALVENGGQTTPGAYRKIYSR